MIKSESWTSQAGLSDDDDKDDGETDFTMTVRESPGHGVMANMGLSHLPINRCESDLIREEIGRHSDSSLLGLAKRLPSCMFED